MMQRVYRAMTSSPSTAPASNITTRTRERTTSQGEKIGTAALSEETGDASSLLLLREHAEARRIETELAELAARIAQAKVQEAELLREQRAIVTTLPAARGSTPSDSLRGSSPEPTQHTLITLIHRMEEQRQADVRAAAEREERLMAALTSRPASPRPTSKQGSPTGSPRHATSDLVTMMTMLEELRRADRQEAIERENQTLERMEARHRAQWAAVQTGGQPTAGRYIVGAALATTVARFTGDGDQNWDEWLRGFDRMARAHNVPESAWTNEVSIKLAGLAGNFVETQFPAEASREM